MFDRWHLWSRAAALVIATLQPGCTSENVDAPGEAVGGAGGSAGAEGDAGGDAGAAGNTSAGGSGSETGGSGGSGTGGSGGSETGGTGGSETGGAAGADGGATGTNTSGVGGSAGQATSTGGTDSCDPQLHCGGDCVDPASDPEYCGASGDCLGDNAGVRCAAGQTCHDGGCTSWEAPTKLEMEPAPTCRWLDLAMNEDGLAVLAWYDGDIRTSFYAPDTGWAAVERLDTPSGTADAGNPPSAALSHEGSAMVVWDSIRNDNVRILWSSRRELDSTWADAQLVDPNQSVSSLELRACEIAVDAAGDAVVVCSTESSPGIWSNYFTQDGGWADTVFIKEGGFYSPVHLAMNPSGRAIVLWDQGASHDSTTSVFATWLDAAWSWVTTETLASDYDSSKDDPDVAIDAQGNAVGVWEDGGYVEAQRFTAGEGWGSTDRIVPPSGPAGFTKPRVGMDGYGNAIVAGYGGDGVWAAHHSVELGWSDVEPIGILVQGSWLWTDSDRLNLKLAVAVAGDAVAVWPEVVEVERNAGEKTDIELWSSRYAPGAGWGEPELIDVAFAGNTISFDVAIDGQGNAIVAWSPEEYPTYGLFVSRSSRPE